MSKINAHLFSGVFALQRLVEKSPVDDGDERMPLDMRSEFEVTMRLLDVPFLLELGGGFAIV